MGLGSLVRLSSCGILRPGAKPLLGLRLLKFGRCAGLPTQTFTCLTCLLNARFVAAALLARIPRDNAWGDIQQTGPKCVMLSWLSSIDLQTGLCAKYRIGHPTGGHTAVGRASSERPQRACGGLRAKPSKMQKRPKLTSPKSTISKPPSCSFFHQSLLRSRSKARSTAAWRQHAN